MRDIRHILAAAAPEVNGRNRAGGIRARRHGLPEFELGIDPETEDSLVEQSNS